MIFTSVSFIIFFLLVFVVASVFKSQVKAYKIFLLLVSSIFYGIWNIQLLLILLTNVCINYYFNRRTQKNKSASIFFPVLINILYLGIFKYFDFFIDSALQILQPLGIEFVPLVLKIGIPLGISYYTFKNISHIVDVKKGKIISFSFLDFANYIMFFPQIIAGPLARAEDFYRDLNSKVKYQYQIGESATLLLSGFIKKYVLASYLFGVINGPFDAPTNYSSLELFVVMIAYSALLYVDFSGYSDIANGVSSLLGFKPTPNFNSPYKSASLREFWTRWHISFSEWIRDYIYFPLGGSRKGVVRKYFNLMITMIIGGIWHGASWTFVAWGALHGFGLWVNHFFRWLYGEVKFLKPIGVIVTFLFVSVAWIFFASQSIDLALQYIQHMFSFTGLNASGEVVNSDRIINMAVIYVITLVLLGNIFGDKIVKYSKKILNLNIVLTTIIAIVVIYIGLELGPDVIPPFIYQQF